MDLWSYVESIGTTRGGGAFLNMKVTYKCHMENEKKGAFGVKISLKKGVTWCGLQKNGIFFYVDSQKWGSFGLQNCNFSAKICKFYVKITAKLVNLSKWKQSVQKFAICMWNLVQKWKKGGHWVWTEEKRGSLGVRSALKRGSVDRHLISTDIWECPPPPGYNLISGWETPNPRIDYLYLTISHKHLWSEQSGTIVLKISK